MRAISLFSGFGGFDLASEWMQWQNVAHCEINEFCRKILKYYWPNAISYEDITKTDFTIHRGKIDIVTGGFPCQPYSSAGKRKGTADHRHLWPEMLRAIREIQPGWVVGENVRGLTNWNKGLVFNQVQADLEAEGYEVTSFILPSASIGAEDLRERIWFVAYSNSFRRKNLQSFIKSGKNKTRNFKRSRKETKWRRKKTDELDSSCNSFLRFTEMYSKPPIFAMDDGLPFELDGITVSKWIEESLKAAGNAINPNVAYNIFKTIEKYENTRPIT